MAGGTVENAGGSKPGPSDAVDQPPDLRVIIRSEKPKSGFGEVLTLARDLTLFMAATMYFLGFVYQYYYFSSLGVSLGQLQIPVYYFFVYSYGVISRYWWLLAFGTFICSIGIRLSQKAYQRFAVWRPVIAGLPALLVVFVLFGAARAAGARLAAEVRNGNYAPQVKFVFKAEIWSILHKELEQANNADQLRLLTQTSDMYYVLSQDVPSNGFRELPVGYVYFVPRSEVWFTQVQLQNIPKP